MDVFFAVNMNKTVQVCFFICEIHKRSWIFMKLGQNSWFFNTKKMHLRKFFFNSCILLINGIFKVNITLKHRNQQSQAKQKVPRNPYEWCSTLVLLFFPSSCRNIITYKDITCIFLRSSIRIFILVNCLVYRKLKSADHFKSKVNGTRYLFSKK